MKQQDLILNRIFMEENTNIRRNKRFALHPADVHYYEEFASEVLDNDFPGPKILVTLYNGDGIIFLKDFDSFYKLIQDYREISRGENFIKNRIFKLETT